jgi:hypothetical protein
LTRIVARFVLARLRSKAGSSRTTWSIHDTIDAARSAAREALAKVAARG